MSGKSKSSASRKPRQPKFEVRFANYTPAEASGQATDGLSAKNRASRLYSDHLKLNVSQTASVQNIYAENKETDILYRALDPQSQREAQTFLAAHGLDLEARESLVSRWSVKWGKISGKSSEATQRILLQCDCGYDHTLDNIKHRRNPFDFTGCLAHAEITVGSASKNILRIRGHFEHNEGCQKAVIMRMPELQVHPSVYIIALAQLRDGASITEVQSKNRALFKARGYRDQPIDLSKSPYRWILKQSDFRALYRQYNRLLMDVKVTEKPEVNINEWLDPESPTYNKTLADAVFYYSARTKKDERFKICISTEEMREASWKYAHKSQIMLDGTFGLCDRRILVFILMGIDEERKGVPLSFLLFSAPSGNKQTSAGYNTDVIAELLGEWKKSLGNRNGEAFLPLVAITDTDVIERGALLRVFPDLWLLLCKFHVRQSWRNHRNRHLKGKSPIHMDLKHRLWHLEGQLIGTTVYQDALDAIAREWEVLESLREEAPAPVEKGLTHLKYLRDYWTREELWRSWSDYGRHVAARILSCPFEGVLPTTNHLESFNNLLKNKHVRRWQRNGRRLRIDVLVKTLVTQIIPAIFEQRSLEREEYARIDRMIRSLPGGAAVLQKSVTPDAPPVLYVYLVPDERRDAAAQQLLANRQISAPALAEDNSGLWLECISSKALENDNKTLTYRIWLGFNGFANCNCADFGHKGGACKHIRAALLRVDAIRLTMHIPPIPIPQTIEESRNKSFVVRASASPTVLETSSPSPASVTNGGGPVARVARVVDDLLHETDEFYLEGNSETSKTTEMKDGADEDVSDSDSVATDAEESDVGEGDEFDFTLPEASSSKAALDSQVTSRIFFEMENAIPKLDGLGVFLEQSNFDLANVPTAVKFRDHLLALAEKFSKAIQRTAPSSDPSLPNIAHPAVVVPLDPSEPVTARPAQSRTQKRSGILILLPSPEKRQKRKKSYGAH